MVRETVFVKEWGKGVLSKARKSKCVPPDEEPAIWDKEVGRTTSDGETESQRSVLWELSSDQCCLAFFSFF